MQNSYQNSTTQNLTGTPAPVRVRCPECLKLFAINPAQIQERRPRFQCAGCQKKFWLSFPEALEAKDVIMGFPLEWIEPNASAESPSAPSAPTSSLAKPYACPKCSSAYSPEDHDCPNCGVILQKARLQDILPNEQSLSASKEIKELWEDVLTNYENYLLHQRFVRAAYVDRSLTYAANKYASILQACPQDEMALKATKEIEALATARFEVQQPTQSESEPVSWGFQFRRLPFTNIIIVLCGFIIITGVLLPELRNLVGFGCSVLFFIFILRYYMRAI